MNSPIIWAIARKDMKAIWSNNRIWLPIVIVPIVLCVIIPAVFVLTIRFGGVSASNDLMKFVDQVLSTLPEGSLRDALFSLGAPEKQMLYLTSNYLLSPFFLMVPVMTSLLIATGSFVGEKERRTLESLLFAPISISGLFVGKVLASWIPTMLLSIGSYVACGVVVNVLGAPLSDGLLLTGANWIVLIVWVVPVFSLTAILLSVLISARVKGFQEAQQIGGIIVLPIVALVVSQFAGLFLLSAGVLFAIGLVLLAVNAALLWQVTRMNKRSILFENQIH